MGTFTVNPIRVIGRGGFGFVEEVVVADSDGTPRVGTRLARKRLNPQWHNHPQAVARFEREIRAVGEMNHKNIVPLRGVSVPHSPERFYVMPLYKMNLRDAIEAQPTGYSWTFIVNYVQSLTDALQHAHDTGYIHRDIKPENILVDHKNTPVISDWGLGYFLHKESVVLDLTKAGMGTAYYCSAEQWATGKCGPSGDVYSLGMTIAELITGTANRVQISWPGSGITSDIVPVTSPHAKRLNFVLRRMTAREAGHRYQTMREVGSELLKISWGDLLRLDQAPLG